MASELGVQTIQHTNGTDALTVDSSGNLTAPQSLVITNQPRLLVTGSNGAYVNTTPIPFPNVILDNRSGWSTSNNEYTVPVAGDYFVNVCLGIVQTSETVMDLPRYSTTETMLAILTSKPSLGFNTNHCL